MCLLKTYLVNNAKRGEAMAVINLAKLLTKVPYQGFYNGNSITITGVKSDSSKVKPGDIFVAIKGQQQDGHSFIKEAINRGAAAIVAEKKPSNSAVTWIRVAGG